MDSRIPFWKIEGSVMSRRFVGGSRVVLSWALEESGSDTTLRPVFFVSLAGGVFRFDDFMDGPRERRSCKENERFEGTPLLLLGEVVATSSGGGGEDTGILCSSAESDLRPGAIDSDSKPKADGGLLLKKTLSSS
jgi:hypothetical protein